MCQTGFTSLFPRWCSTADGAMLTNIGRERLEQKCLSLLGDRDGCVVSALVPL